MTDQKAAPPRPMPRHPESHAADLRAKFADLNEAIDAACRDGVSVDIDVDDTTTLAAPVKRSYLRYKIFAVL